MCHFQTEKDAQTAFREMLPNILESVITFLEDPESTFEEPVKQMRRK